MQKVCSIALLFTMIASSIFTKNYWLAFVITMGGVYFFYGRLTPKKEKFLNKEKASEKNNFSQAEKSKNPVSKEIQSFLSFN